MDKNTGKNTNKNNQKGMSRAEFAQEYSIDTGKSNKNTGKSGAQKSMSKDN